MRTGGADQVLTRDTEQATGAQGRPGGPGLYRVLSRLGDAQGQKLAEAGQARQIASLTPQPNSSQRDMGDRATDAPPH